MVFLSHCPHAFDRPPGLDAAFAGQDGRTYDCLSPAGASTVQLCRFGRTTDPARTIAVVGNSHARRLIPALDEYGRVHGWQILDATEINCMGVISRPIGAESAGDGCVQWSQRVIHDLLNTPHLDAVIFASFNGAARFLTGEWTPTATDEQAARQAMLQTWSAFTHRGIRVIVPEDVPGVRPNSDPECIAQSNAAHDPCAVSRAAAVKPNIMDTLAREHPNIATYLRTDQYFCDRLRCHGLIGGLVVYFDSNHMTATFSRSLAPYLGAQLARLLRPN
jgi:hypothetical protein